MTLEGAAAQDPGHWEHPTPAVCDGSCVPSGDTSELWHHRDPVSAVLARYHDTVSGGAFRDDTISPAGIQTPGEVGWRLQVNDEVVETGIEDMEAVLADQLARVREVIDALARVPQPRGA